MDHLDDMLDGYRTAVLAAPSAAKLGVTELTTDAEDRMVADCSDFIHKAPAEIWARMSARDVGRDFWLTRNDDTLGFSHRDLGLLGDVLHNLAISFPVVDIFVDGGIIEFQYT